MRAPSILTDARVVAGSVVVHYCGLVVGETYHQALDAAELIAVEYEPLPAGVSTAEAVSAAAPRVWDDCHDNIGFVQLFGDKAVAEAAIAKADHVIKHRF